MSRAPRDAYHAARLLQNELARIASKRERQIGKANSDFQLELIQAVSGAVPSALKLVRQVLREDASQMHLASALGTLLETTGREIANDDDRSERETDAPPAAVFELRRPLETTTDGNEAWGMPPLPEREHRGGPGLLPPLPASAYPPGGVDLPPIDAEFEDPGVDGPPAGYRYPEPGEPAIELPDGTVVFDASSPLEGLPL